jgi:hypothetical protein
MRLWDSSQGSRESSFSSFSRSATLGLRATRRPERPWPAGVVRTVLATLGVWSPKRFEAKATTAASSSAELRRNS